MTRTSLAVGLAMVLPATVGWCDEADKAPRPPVPRVQIETPNPEPRAVDPVEIAPVPRATGNLLLPTVPVYTPPEHGRLSVWQLYGVDSTGRFRPRVIQSPYGAYYLHNFAPYPWTTTNSLRYMPYAVD